MSTKASVVIKICSNATSFIVYRDKRVVLWDSVNGGEHHIINDVSQCLRLKFNDAEQLTKAKGVCLSEAVGIKEDKILAEIIEARVEQIFNNIKELLDSKGLLKETSCFFITKDDNYIPDMDKLLSKVIGIQAKSVDLSTVIVSVRAPSEFEKMVVQYF